MPKIERREFRWQKKKVRCNNANQHSGGGSRARKNHIVQNVNSGITT